MFKLLSAALATSFLLANAGYAETHEVLMRNKGDEGRMIFEPAALRVATGDTVKFIATDKGHNAETQDGMLPAGADGFAGKINEEIEVTLTENGFYGIKCKPHFAMGMVMVIVVGDETEVPAEFLEGRLPKKALTRFEDALSNL